MRVTWCSAPKAPGADGSQESCSVRTELSLEGGGQSVWPVASLVFLDETGVTTDSIRRYGRSPRGTRLIDHTPCGHWQACTVVAAWRMTGVTAPAVLDSPMDTDRFQADVDQVLCPPSSDEVCRLIAAALHLFAAEKCLAYLRNFGYVGATR